MLRLWLVCALVASSVSGCSPSAGTVLVTRPAPPVGRAVAPPPRPVAEDAEPEEDVGALAEPLASDPGVTDGEPNGPLRTAAYADAVRADASGRPLGATTVHRDPVYLQPRHYPVVLPGSPSTLPAFTPRPVDISRLPTDAFVELSRLGRLRDRKRGAFAWLVGYSFPKVTADVARLRLREGASLWLAPSGSHWHRDRAYAEVREARTIEGMLDELRRAALDAAAREAREANIEARTALTPAFNGTFDVQKLWLAERIVDGFTYGGQPVRRGVVTAAGLFEQRWVKRRIATYWEDHPGCAASELRQVAASALLERFEDVRRSAVTYAANPAVYTDAQLIPGLRDPRPVVDGDRTWYDSDVRYNAEAIEAMCRTMPAVLPSAVYP